MEKKIERGILFFKWAGDSVAAFVNIKKTNIDTLPEDLQKEMKDLETAWLKTKWQRDNLK